MTLTAARILAAHKDEFVGKIVFCFERGEETSGDIRNLLPYIVHDLKLSIDGCYATHVRWDMAAGTVSLCPGPVMSGGCALLSSFLVSLVTEPGPILPGARLTVFTRFIVSFQASGCAVSTPLNA